MISDMNEAYGNIVTSGSRYITIALPSVKVIPARDVTISDHEHTGCQCFYSIIGNVKWLSSEFMYTDVRTPISRIGYRAYIHVQYCI